jgi:hypothetical protein
VEKGKIVIKFNIIYDGRTYTTALNDIESRRGKQEQNLAEAFHFKRKSRRDLRDTFHFKRKLRRDIRDTFHFARKFCIDLQFVVGYNSVIQAIIYLRLSVWEIICIFAPLI